MPKATLKIIQLSIDGIKARPGNARTHNRKQLLKLVAAIETFGFLVPVLIDQQNILLAGHGRLEAAKMAGLLEVPAIYVKHLSPEQIRAFVLFDNKITELGEWDKELLGREFAALSELVPMTELLSTGFELAEIELLADVPRSRTTQAPEPPLPAVDRSQPAITSLGDCWLIGDHRLLCQDALQHESYVQLLGRDQADLVICDPPFNRKVNGEISGKGTKHDEFVMASGEMTRTQFQRFLATTCMNLAAFSKSGSLHYIFIDWRSIHDLLAAGEAHYEALLNILVWVKDRGGMGSMYRSQHELVALFKHGTRTHRNRIELGVNGRNRTNVWEYPGANSASRRGDLQLHPTVKNLDMITDAIKDASDPDDLVLDPFGGSGTLLLGAERCGRRARMMELDPYYCDLIVSRAQKAGLTANLENTGATFEAVRATRLTDVDGAPVKPGAKLS